MLAINSLAGKALGGQAHTTSAETITQDSQYVVDVLHSKLSLPNGPVSQSFLRRLFLADLST